MEWACPSIKMNSERFPKIRLRCDGESHRALDPRRTPPAEPLLRGKVTEPFPDQATFKRQMCISR
jgi:hypothetical protein